MPRLSIRLPGVRKRDVTTQGPQPCQDIATRGRCMLAYIGRRSAEPEERKKSVSLSLPGRTVGTGVWVIPNLITSGSSIPALKTLCGTSSEGSSAGERWDPTRGQDAEADRAGTPLNVSLALGLMYRNISGTSACQSPGKIWRGSVRLTDFGPNKRRQSRSTGRRENLLLCCIHHTSTRYVTSSSSMFDPSPLLILLFTYLCPSHKVISTL
jgi:hypothetical protein